MKNINQIKNQIRKLHKNNKGIETRVLIYVLAAIALIAAIYIVNNVNQKAGEMTNNALIVASASGDIKGSKEICATVKCGPTNCPTLCCTPGEYDSEKKEYKTCPAITNWPTT
jgi:hypothetical protein